MWLTVITGRDAGKVVELAGGRLVVGTRRGCDLVLRDPGVAPVHAAFHPLEGGGYALEDLGSPGGTFVETRRIERPYRLAGTEQLCFGETFAALSLERPAGARRARGRRVPRPVVAAALLGLAAAGVTAAVLGPLAGGDGESGALHVVAPTAAARSGAPAAPSGGQATSGPAPTTETPPTTAPRPGLRVAFRDGFSDPSSGWEVTTGEAATAGYREGRYVVEIRDPTYFLTADSGRSFRRPLVSVTAAVEEPGAYAGFGIVCGYRQQLEFYALAIGTDGTAAILHEHGGALDVLSGGGRWLPSAAVRAGASRYRLRAECAGDRLVLWVDGRRAVSARVGGVRGRVGLFAAGRVRLAFDDLVVRVPQA
jgi:hypothetical protein